MQIPILSEKHITENVNSQKNPFFDDYYAFYSSWFGGIVTNPRMMLLPIDDHMVHRGDGVFEAMKSIARGIYLFDEHIERLLRSAQAIGLQLPFNRDEMKHIILETAKVANRDDVIVRVFLSRGPGNFSVNPYDSVKSQFYVVITKLNPPSAEKYEKGVVVGKSSVPMKESWMAQVKSCNYLPNVMMKKESVDRHLDFVIGVDEKGFVTEGPTENIMIVDAKGNLIHPGFDNILKGTTMTRVCELARANEINTESRPFTLEELKTAREIMMCGTTLDVLAVREFEGHKVGEGKPGPIAIKLLELIRDDLKNGPKRTVF